MEPLDSDQFDRGPRPSRAPLVIPVCCSAAAAASGGAAAASPCRPSAGSVVGEGRIKFFHNVDIVCESQTLELSAFLQPISCLRAESCLMLLWLLLFRLFAALC